MVALAVKARQPSAITRRIPVTINFCRNFNALSTRFLTWHPLFSRITDMNAFTQLLNVAITRIDTELPLPNYATAGSVGFDLICREDVEIAARDLGRIP